MRRTAFALAVALAMPAWAKDPCPSPTVKIKGPCPTEVRCTNLGDVHAVCAPCPTPAVVNCPSPCPPLPVKECPPCEAPTPTPQAAPKPPQGLWSVPISLGWLPPFQTSLSWSQRVRRPIDPSLDVSYSHSLLFAAGLAYQFPSRWQVAAQAVWVDAGTARAAWDELPRLKTYPRVRTGQPEAKTSGGDIGVLVTVQIPLGGRP